MAIKHEHLWKVNSADMYRVDCLLPEYLLPNPFQFIIPGEKYDDAVKIFNKR